MSKPIPEWLAKTGKPVFWAYRNTNGPKLVSKGIVDSHSRGRVYMVGKDYGCNLDPKDIKQVHGKKDGDYLKGEFADA